MVSSVAERPRRRKIALACEPCRDRKSRCDGGTPICSTCHRRGLALDMCIYKLDNARTASNEAYLRALHDRIRALENSCKDNGVPIPPVDGDGCQPIFDTASEDHQPPERNDGVAIQSNQAATSIQHKTADPIGERIVQEGLAGQAQDLSAGLSPASSSQNTYHTSTPSLPLDLMPLAPGDQLDSPDTSNGVTAMGTLSTTDGDVSSVLKGTNEFYGSSSAAFFIKETYGSMDGSGRLSSATSLFGDAGRSRLESNPFVDILRGTHTFHFTLPPRFVADQLLNQFWQRVYYLYPVFHRPTFESAYQSLWEGRPNKGTAVSNSELGLGSSPGAGPGTIVFHCALNTIFALGCLFLDVPVSEKTNATQIYFLRAKQLIGLDFLDMNNIGVVQSLLLMTLFLQSTPFASRCWNAVGLAYRVAQGLGLHSVSDQSSLSSLEREIRKRTWHCCIVLDRLVSMTFGRPTITANLSGRELPSTIDNDGICTLDSARNIEGIESSRYIFNVEHIRLCNILGEILLQIFQTADKTMSWKDSNGRFDETYRGLEVILALDARLSVYVKTVHPSMSWTQPQDFSSIREDVRSVLETQRNVLHVRFLYVRLMLHRPTLTQACMTSNMEINLSSPPDVNRLLYQSCISENAKICVQSAIQLLEVVSRIYKTPTSTTWWWAGLYTSTAGLVLLISRSNPLLEAAIGQQTIEQSWHICQVILKDLSALSLTAQRSLKLLQALHAKSGAQIDGNNIASGAPGLDASDDNDPVSCVSNSSRNLPRFRVSNNEFETMNSTGLYTAGSIFPETNSEELPNLDIDGSFVNWDQAMGFMADAPGVIEPFYQRFQ